MLEAYCIIESKKNWFNFGQNYGLTVKIRHFVELRTGIKKGLTLVDKG